MYQADKVEIVERSHLQGEAKYSGHFGAYCLCRLCAFHSVKRGFCPIHDQIVEQFHVWQIRAPVFECFHFRATTEKEPETLYFMPNSETFDQPM